MGKQRASEAMMIGRVWHGWTTPANADIYEQVLREEVFEGIAAKGVAGYRGIELLRRPLDGEVEFMTIMWFESLEDVRAFAGEDYEQAYVPAKPRTLLARFDQRAQHYEIVERRQY